MKPFKAGSVIPPSPEDACLIIKPCVVMHMQNERFLWQASVEQEFSEVVALRKTSNLHIMHSLDDLKEAATVIHAFATLYIPRKNCWTNQTVPLRISKEAFSTVPA